MNFMNFGYWDEKDINLTEANRRLCDFVIDKADIKHKKLKSQGTLEPKAFCKICSFGQTSIVMGWVLCKMARCCLQFAGFEQQSRIHKK